MANAERANEDREYWRALQDCVCSVCLDRRDDGSCGLPRARVCGLKRHLPVIADVVHNVDSLRMDDYLTAVQGSICSRCPDQDAAGRCEYREKAQCALYTYLPLVLDAIEHVDDKKWRKG
jgi:hypothetical protein